MADENLLTVFVALTAVAVLIQTGILIGMFFVTHKIGKQADQATQLARRVMSDRMGDVVQTLQTASTKASEYNTKTQQKLTEWRSQFDRVESVWHQRLARWARRPA